MEVLVCTANGGEVAEVSRFQLQTLAALLLNLEIKNLFLHNNHWKDKHVVTVWLCGMVRQGQPTQRAKMVWYVC